MNLEDLLNPPDTTEQYEMKDIEENKPYAFCSYLLVLFLIPLLARPGSKFARFHTNQGIVLFIMGVIVAVLSWLLSLIPLVGGIVAWVVGTLGGLAVLALSVVGIINSATGRAKELPLIGNVRFLK